MSDETGRGDASWLDGVDIPDDLSELQADIDAYYRERRHAARRRRFAPLTDSGVWQRYALPAGVVIGSITIAAAVLGILTLDQPRRIAGPPKAPLETAASAAPGEIGGLVPDVVVGTSIGAMHLRDLRPALVAMVPMPCDCTRLMSVLAAQADEVAVPLVVVAPGGTDAEVASLPGQLHRGEVEPVFDLHGQLAAAYHASGVTVLTLLPNGTVGVVERDVIDSVRLEGPLGQMLMPAESVRGG